MLERDLGSVTSVLLICSTNAKVMPIAVNNLVYTFSILVFAYMVTHTWIAFRFVDKCNCLSCGLFLMQGLNWL